MPFTLSRRDLMAGATAMLLPDTIIALEMRMFQPREIMWRRVMDDLSFEHASIKPAADGFELTGTVLVAEKGAPLRLEYRVICNAEWSTRSVEIRQSHLGRRQEMRLDHAGDGRWRLNGMEAPELAGCTDVDLGLSPSTNTLPINRLRLGKGASRTILAAWVRFPSLAVVPAEQSYQRLGERRYLYRSLASGFEAEVEVDIGGMPIDYSGVWRRVSEGPVASVSAETGCAEGFLGALLASGPSAELDRAADDFGWLVGGWSARVRDFEDHGHILETNGEWWFAWVLEGRALQDVWISPARPGRASLRSSPPGKDRYGTTIRRFDREAGVWRVTWINPVNGATNHLAGGREGDRIVLLGDQDGTPVRWSFNDITPRSFTWVGESRHAEGGWKKEAEFELARMD